MAIVNIKGKGENFTFPTMSPTVSKTNSVSMPYNICHMQILSTLDQSTILSFIFDVTLYQLTKSLDWSKLKAFADDKINSNEKLKLLRRARTIVGKGENDGCQHFFLFQQCFQNPPHSVL